MTHVPCHASHYLFNNSLSPVINTQTRQQNITVKGQSNSAVQGTIKDRWTETDKDRWHRKWNKWSPCLTCLHLNGSSQKIETLYTWICSLVWSLCLQTVHSTLWWTSQEAQVECVRVCEWIRRSDIEATDRKEKETESREQETETSSSKMKGRCDKMKADDAVLV